MAMAEGRPTMVLVVVVAGVDNKPTFSLPSQFLSLRNRRGKPVNNIIIALHIYSAHLN